MASTEAVERATTVVEVEVAGVPPTTAVGAAGAIATIVEEAVGGPVTTEEEVLVVAEVEVPLPVVLGGDSNEFHRT
jgi:hypothetical protein